MKGRACLPFPFWLLFCFHKTESMTGLCAVGRSRGIPGPGSVEGKVEVPGRSRAKQRSLLGQRGSEVWYLENLHLNQMWNMSTFYIQCFYILFLPFPIFLHPHHLTPINRGLESVMRPEDYEFQATTQQFRLTPKPPFLYLNALYSVSDSLFPFHPHTDAQSLVMVWFV